jgi:hypothetical protein
LNSNTEIADYILKRIEFLILQYLPKPDCALKREKWRWQVDEVKKKVSEKLYQQNNGITIEIKP